MNLFARKAPRLSTDETLLYCLFFSFPKLIHLPLKNKEETRGIAIQRFRSLRKHQIQSTESIGNQCISGLTGSWNCSKLFPSDFVFSFLDIVFYSLYTILTILCYSFKSSEYFSIVVLKSRSRSKDRWSNLCFPIHLQWQFL